MACQMLAVAGALGQLPATRITAISPLGGKAGSELTLTIAAGTDLEGVQRLTFSHPGITAAQKLATVEGKPDPQPVANQFQVTIAADVPPGTYDVRAVGTYGVSNPRAFAVGDRNELTETEPNNAREQANEVTVGSWVNGKSEPAKDVDWFRFAAQAGQRLLLEVWAERLDSRLDATLELYDAGGKLLTLVRDTYHFDPLIDFRAPADGEYFVKVRDLQYRGGADYPYRLGVSAAPHIDFVFPPAGLPGSKGAYTVFGRNLPGGAPSEVAIGGEPLEQLAVEIELPAEHAAPLLNFDSPRGPAALGVAGASYRLSGPNGASNAALVSLATAPVIVEQEPNDEAPQVVTPDCEIAGQFGQPGDRDVFRFAGKKDDVYWIEVYSQRIDAPCDPLLIVQQVGKNEQGAEVLTELKAEDDAAANIGGQSFNTTSGDPVFRLACPADGEYQVAVQDLYRETRGGPHLLYRLAIRRPRPDFSLAVLPEFPVNGQQAPNPWTSFVRKGGTDLLRVLALRQDGFAGEIEVSIEGLPEGVTCRPTTIGPNLGTAMLVIEASEAAADWAGPIRVRGQAKIGEEVATREAMPATVLIAAQNQRGIARLGRDLLLSVGQTAPYLLQAQTNELRVPQGHWIRVPVKATRRGDFAGDLALTAVGIPPNVQNEAITLAAAQTETALYLYAQADAPPGKYSLYVQSSTSVPFTKNADGSDKKPIATVDGSTPVDVTIVASPLTLAPKPPNNGAFKQGTTLEVPVEIARRNGFAGPVTLDLYIPPEAVGIQAAPVTIAADQNAGTLVIQAAADAAEGPRPHVAVRASLEQAGEKFELHQPIPIVIQK